MTRVWKMDGVTTVAMPGSGYFKIGSIQTERYGLQIVLPKRFARSAPTQADDHILQTLPFR